MLPDQWKAYDEANALIDELLEHAHPGRLVTAAEIETLCGRLLRDAGETPSDALFALVMDGKLEPAETDWWNNEDTDLTACRVPAPGQH